MSYTNSKSVLMMVLFFLAFYFVVSLVNQIFLGNNPTVTLFQNLYIGSVFGLLAFKSWRRYKKFVGSVAKEKIVNIVDPRTVVTVISFFAFTTILGAFDKYNDLGISHFVTILTLGPLLVAFSSGSIPLSLLRKRQGWRSR
ncbi:MAG: hypothetical protein ACREBI_02875 [Nitrosotalea sp.]